VGCSGPCERARVITHGITTIPCIRVEIFRLRDDYVDFGVSADVQALFFADPRLLKLLVVLAK
jgi:hypothetical protein